MSKNNPKNFKKYNKDTNYNNMNKNNEKILNSEENKTKEVLEDLKKLNDKINNKEEHSVLEDLFKEIQSIGQGNKIKENKTEKEETEENVDNFFKSEEYIDKKDTNNIEVEKSIECTALRKVEKKSFFLLLLKLITVFIINFFKITFSKIKILFIVVKDFFEDRAEELDRRIKEVKDEAIIKEKKTKLEYEKYNTKRIYKDLERAEIYKERASNRINTEKYFEEKIEKEKINNKILVPKIEEESREEKKSQDINKTANQYSSNRKNRIEKKKLEILKLKKRKKIEKEKQQEKEELPENLFFEKAPQIISDNKPKIYEEIPKAVQNKNEIEPDDDLDIYDDIFNEFGSEEEFDVDNTSQVNHIQNTKKSEKVKTPIFLKKDENRINEPYEKFEKNNDVREAQDSLKSEILKIIDTPSKNNFITEIEVDRKSNNAKNNTNDIFSALKNSKSNNIKKDENVKLNSENSKIKNISKENSNLNQKDNSNTIVNNESKQNEKIHNNQAKNDIVLKYGKTYNQYNKSDKENDNTNQEVKINKEIIEDVNKDENTNKLNRLFKTETKKKSRSEFDRELYTNKFMKNIIDFDEEPYKVTSKNIDENYVVAKKKDDEIDITIYTPELKEKSKVNTKNKNENILNKQNYEENLKGKDINKNIKIDDKEEENFGTKIKDVASSINLSISGIPEAFKKKRESKNRIKKNRIYSTSFNKKKGKRK
ncbi:MAG: hypothetical protein HFJ43_03640 [Clostridia bacterium]|nr:hypothetical protein [Clostridia bacterium]